MRAAGGLPGVGPVAAAAAVHLVANAVSVTTWRRIAAVAGARLTWPAAAWVWAASQLARYGLSGAQVAGRAVLGRRYGLTGLAGAVTALVETAWQFAITAVLVLATVPWWLPGASDLRWVALAALVPAAVLVVGSVAPMRLLAGAARIATWSPVRRVTGGRLATSVDGVTLSPATAARVTGPFLVNTALRVAAFLVLFAAVGGSPQRDAGIAVGAYAIGQVAGRVAVFAPGGVGAQEGATALVLAPVLGGPVALLLVAVTRLAEVLGELAFLGLARWRRPVSSPARVR
ncbi:MAG: flippase-like domain-containing protein [Actinobacteria bacterium]|nr:flippase-like domain-containing protein [Actinomycetota bacterium]